MKNDKTEKLFESKKLELENAYDEFGDFYSKMDDHFREREVSNEELELIGNIKQIVEQLDKGKKNASGSFSGYGSWTGDDLTRADSRLAGMLLPLGELASEKIQKANVMGRFVKWKRYNEWSPAKALLEKNLADLSKDGNKRVIKEEIEAVVSKKIFAESVIESMLSGHADKLMTMFDATKSILTALAHRINLKRDERSLNRK